jgi:hypothetical protein
VRYQDEINRTGVPLKFMNEVGFTKTMRRVESKACCAASFFFQFVMP